jgi:hypothetical protein
MLLQRFRLFADLVDQVKVVVFCCVDRVSEANIMHEFGDFFEFVLGHQRQLFGKNADLLEEELGQIVLLLEKWVEHELVDGFEVSQHFVDEILRGERTT